MHFRSGVRHPLLFPCLAGILLAAAMASLLTGPAHIGWRAGVAALGHDGDPIVRAILLDLRLPRTLLAILVGAMLGIGGAGLQGYLRNPLAEPAVLGISGTAALGAVVAIYWSLVQASPLLLPLLAVIGALAGLVPLLSLAARGESTLTLVLAGLALATLAGAAISLALNLSPNPFAAMEITIWLLGSVENGSWRDVWIAAPCVLAGGLLLVADGRALDALSLGEESARTLGVDLRAARLRLLLGIAIGVGGAVAVSGAIGFVGLIVPHLVRPWTDRSPAAVLLPSALAGAALLLVADLGVRLLPTPVPLRLGVLTAFVGVPVLVRHLLKERRSW